MLPPHRNEELGSKARRRLLLVLAISLAASGGGGAAEIKQRIKGGEIKARFVGMELTDDVHWAYVFKPGGKLASFSMGKAGTGTWRVKGDELCLELPWTARGVSRCGWRERRSS